MKLVIAALLAVAPLAQAETLSYTCHVYASTRAPWKLVKGAEQTANLSIELATPTGPKFARAVAPIHLKGVDGGWMELNSQWFNDRPSTVIGLNLGRSGQISAYAEANLDVPYIQIFDGKYAVVVNCKKN